MKKVIITGATGFIGGALVKRLLSKGVTVYGIDIDKNKLDIFRKYGNFVPVVADFSKYDNLSEIITERDFDVFYHFAWAGLLGGRDLFDYNLQIDNSKAACKACEQAISLKVKKFIFISSSYQYMVDNSTGKVNNNIYGIAKQYTENICFAIANLNNMEYCSAILTNTFGEGDYSNKAVNTFIRKLLNNEKLELITGIYPNDWMYIDETINGLEFLIDSATPNKVYIGHTNITTFKEKLIEMKKVLNSDSVLEFGVYNDNTHVDYEALKLLCISQEIIKSEVFSDYILKTAEWLKIQISERN